MTAQTPPPAGDEIKVGQEIRRWRTARGLTLAQVADAAGTNLSYLSQIERDKATPSLAVLAAIGRALAIPPAWFLVETSAPVVVRADARPRLVSGPTTQATHIDGGASTSVLLVEIVTEPNDPPEARYHTHGGSESFWILEGNWRLRQGSHDLKLQPGDFVKLEPTIPHSLGVEGPNPGRLLAIYPPTGAADLVLGRPAAHAEIPEH